MNDLKFDLIIIGGGAAGLVAAVASGTLGAKTLLIEKEKLGGECSWTGCMPSKTLISIANQFYRLKKGFLNENSEVKMFAKKGLSGVFEYVHEIINSAPKRSKAGALLKKLDIKTVFGEPVFLDNHNIEIDGKIYNGKKFIISTGSSAALAPIKGLDSGFLTNRQIWDLKEVPESLLIIGGGPIGVEMAQAFNRLGAKVVLFHNEGRILPKDDPELSVMLKDRLIEEGVKIYLNHTVKEVIRTKSGWEIPLEDNPEPVGNIQSNLNKKNNEKGRYLLISLGRNANVAGLELEAAGISFDKKSIYVDKYLKTTAPNIWAAGDCTGKYQFSHIAEAEAKIAVRNALFPLNFKVDYQGIPWTTFTDPEMAHLGYTEDQCIKENIKYKVYSSSFESDDRAITEGRDFGKVKIIASNAGKILGAHILGPRAGELINEIVLAKRKNLAIYDIGLTIHVYPTLGLALQRATDDYFSDIADKPFYRKLINFLRIK